MYDFLKSFTKYMNSKNIMPFYNDSSSQSTGVYAVISYPAEYLLRHGHQYNFEIYIWADEDSKYEDIVKKANQLIHIIDDLHFDDLLTTVYVENSKKVDDKDYKKIKFNISCTARDMR